jgi:predicted lipid-binding transport protein (Tim44 family)
MFKKNLTRTIAGLFILLLSLLPFLGAWKAVLTITIVTSAIVFMAYFGTVNKAFAALFFGGFVLMLVVGSFRNFIEIFTTGSIGSEGALVMIVLGVLFSAGFFWIVEIQKEKRAQALAKAAAEAEEAAAKAKKPRKPRAPRKKKEASNEVTHTHAEIM